MPSTLPNFPAPASGAAASGVQPKASGDQQRWQRELDSSRAQQAVQSSGVDERLMRAGGAAAGKAAEMAGRAVGSAVAGPVGGVAGAKLGGDIAAAGTEASVGAKKALGGDIAGGAKGLGKVFKTAFIDPPWFPRILLQWPLIQAYWICSINGADWTEELPMERHLAMIVLLVVQTALMMLVFVLMGYAGCLSETLCTIQLILPEPIAKVLN